MKKILASGVVVAGALLITDAMARPNFPTLVPTPFSCATCHDGAPSKETTNALARAFLQNGETWDGVCDLDIDGDGFTNGEELGDPDCAWAPGDALPDFEATHPANPDDFPAEDGAGGEGGEPVGGEGGEPVGGAADEGGAGEGGGDDEGGCQAAAGGAGSSLALMLFALGGLLSRRRFIS